MWHIVASVCVKMVLTIDAGNTKTKWALFDTDGNICHQDACLNSEIANVALLPDTLNCSQIVISNVAGTQHAKQLQQRIAPYQAITSWIKSGKQIANVINHYATPESLGTDRWAALIAAWHIQQKTCVVINAGTATTIDALIHREIDGKTYGEFIGGMILPGIDLMQHSLGIATAQLPNNITDRLTPTQLATSPFATSTANAIYSGAVNATSGAIKQMAHAIAQSYKQQPTILISGGNAVTIKQGLLDNNLTQNAIEHSINTPTPPQTEKTVTIVDNLVLQGLYLLKSPEIHSTTLQSTTQSTLV